MSDWSVQMSGCMHLFTSPSHTECTHAENPENPYTGYAECEKHKCPIRKASRMENRMKDDESGRKVVRRGRHPR